MQIVVTQPRLTHDNHAGNLQVMRQMMRKIAASATPADFVVLPECCFRERNFTAYEAFVRELVVTTKACVVGGSVHASIDSDAPLVNGGVVMAPDGKVLTRYTKRHPYGDEVGHGVTAGEGVGLFTWRDTRCAVLICADVWDTRLLTALQTPPDILFVVAATVSQEHGPVAVRRLWSALAVTRAFECASIVAVSDWVETPVDNHRCTCGVAGLADPSDRSGTFLALPDSATWKNFEVELARLHSFRYTRCSRNFYFW